MESEWIEQNNDVDVWRERRHLKPEHIYHVYKQTHDRHLNISKIKCKERESERNTKREKIIEHFEFVRQKFMM